MMTGNRDTDLPSILARGAYDVIAKPFEFHLLQRRLEAALQAHRFP